MQSHTSYRRISLIKASSVLALFLLLLALSLREKAFAQSFELSNETELSVLPQHPEPESPITVTLNAYTLDLTNASITWYVNGREVTDNRNNITLNLTTGSLGSTERVSATVSIPGKLSMRREITIKPTLVDIQLESDTYIPTFYKGKRLPSTGTAVRAIAIPLTNSGSNPSSYSYKWEYNDELIDGGSILGRQSISFTLSRFDDGVLKVIVFDKNGNIVGEKSLDIHVAIPEMYFYAVNPLRGVSRKAIADTTSLVGDEVTIRGVPYFSETDLSPTSGISAWSIDSHSVEGNKDAPNTITLRSTGESGAAKVELVYETVKAIPQRVAGFFTIFFQ